MNTKGHDFVNDPPLGSSVTRYTCKNCGRAKLINREVVYGSATTEDCDVRPSKKSKKGK